MKKFLIGVGLAGVVYFGWMMTSWMVLPWYNGQIKRLPEETLIRDTVKVVVQEPGLYVFPHCHGPNGKLGAQEYKDLWTKGPVGIMTVGINDPAPLTFKRLLLGFLGALISAFLVGWLLFAAHKEAPCWKSRTLLSVGMGLLVWVASDVVGWIWWSFPMGFTLVVLADRVIGFALMGLVLSGFIPKAE